MCGAILSDDLANLADQRLATGGYPSLGIWFVSLFVLPVAEQMLYEEKHQSRQEQVFNQFIQLVNQYASQERNVSFYADKLCLTPRYLNSLIWQASNRTVMDWINEAVIIEAKVLLEYSNKLIYQIADELNFPNTSFFCKFFKRMTGMTPLAYQKS